MFFKNATPGREPRPDSMPLARGRPAPKPSPRLSRFRFVAVLFTAALPRLRECAGSDAPQVSAVLADLERRRVDEDVLPHYNEIIKKIVSAQQQRVVRPVLAALRAHGSRAGRGGVRGELILGASASGGGGGAIRNLGGEPDRSYLPVAKVDSCSLVKKLGWQGARKAQGRYVFGIREGLRFSKQRSKPRIIGQAAIIPFRPRAPGRSRRTAPSRQGRRARPDSRGPGCRP